MSKDTWMASLKRFNLDLFVINKWEMNELYKKIYYLNKNFIEIKKFYKMRHNINKNNSDKRFIDKMKKFLLINETEISIITSLTHPII